MIRSINVELKKIFTSKSFYICAGITVLLLMTTNILKDGQDKFLSVFNIMFSMDKTQMLSKTDLCSFSVFIKGAGSWLCMFIPIVAVFPMMPLFCDERSGGGIRNSIIRQGKFKYNFSKFISAFISGGCAVALGYMIFGIIVFIAFPPISAYPQQSIDSIFTFSVSNDYIFYDVVQKTGATIVIVTKIIEMFLYGAVSAMPAFLMSSIAKNKYIIMCVPFLVKYVYDQTWIKLLMSQSKNMDKIYNNYSFLNSNSIISIFQNPEFCQRILIVNFGFVVISFIVFNIMMNRRLDLGA